MASQRIGPPPPHIVETEVDGDISLYDPSNQRVVVLNPTASDVWRLSDGQHTLDDLVGLLASAYGAEPHDIHNQVQSALHDLIEQGFLTTNTGPTKTEDQPGRA